MAEHPDLVEWALGQLDPVETRELEAHLDACATCRRDADELRGAHVLLERAAPPFDVPPGWRSASCRDRGAAGCRAWRGSRCRSPPRRPRPRSCSRSARAVQRVALSSTTGEAVDVTAAVQVTPVGREVELDIERLRDPRPDGLYELWFVVGGRQAPRLGGHVPPRRARPRDVRLLAAADPVAYPRLSVTLEPNDGDPRRPGPKSCVSQDRRSGSGAVPVRSSQRARDAARMPRARPGGCWTARARPISGIAAGDLPAISASSSSERPRRRRAPRGPRRRPPPARRRRRPGLRGRPASRRPPPRRRRSPRGRRSRSARRRRS